MRWSTVIGRAVLALSCAAGLAAAQDSARAGPTTPCRTDTCSVVFDWGSGATAASMPTDRRYGAPIDFETSFKQAMTERGFRVGEGIAETRLSMTLRLGIMPAICDFMPGTNTDRSCKTVRDVNITFLNNDPASKKLNSMRFPNRCGAGDQVMTTTQFGRYVADQLQYTFEGEEKRLPRPVGKC
jgi:hypothetical protein